MRNSLLDIFPESVAKLLVSPGLVAAVPRLAKRIDALMKQEYHPDRHLEASASDLALMDRLLTQVASAAADLQDPIGLELAIERLDSIVSRQLVQSRSDDELLQRRQRESVGPLSGLLVNIDQFRVMDISEPTTYMLQAGGGRLVLNVLSHDRTAMYLASEGDDILPEQPERIEYKGKKWTEVYLSPDNPNRPLTYVHKLNPAGRVNVVGFVPAKAVQQYHQEMPLLEGEVFGELGEGLSANVFAPQWSMPTESWFSNHLTSMHRPGAEVVVRNHQGLLAIAGFILAESPME